MRPASTGNPVDERLAALECADAVEGRAHHLADRVTFRNRCDVLEVAATTAGVK
jgi:hypothetical protein